MLSSEVIEFCHFDNNQATNVNEKNFSFHELIKKAEKEDVASVKSKESSFFQLKHIRFKLKEIWCNIYCKHLPTQQ